MSLSLLLILKRRKLRALSIFLKRFTLEGMRGIVREAGLRLLESLAFRRVKVRPEGDEVREPRVL
jgi:hypothetical protein